MQSVREFAGEDFEKAVVPPEARKLLSRFDERSVHYRVVLEPAEKGAGIARIWRAWSSPEKANDYEEFGRRDITGDFSNRLEGYHGLYMLRKDDPKETEFVVITLWRSMDSVRAFAGADYETPVIHPEGAKLLTQ